MMRHLEAEWLDALPAQDRRAQASRRDLRRLNILMGQAELMAAALRARGHPGPRTIVDLGGGDGSFMLRVARKLARACPRNVGIGFRTRTCASENDWRDIRIVSIDRGPLVSEQTRSAFAALGWRIEPVTMDAFDFLEFGERVDAVAVNLFLHHLPEVALRRLFVLAAARTDLLVACEPRRALLPLLTSKLLWLIGCNDVTRHDAVLSVRAGFRGGELSALWPPDAGWLVEEGAAGLFSHRFIACRVRTCANEA